MAKTKGYQPSKREGRTEGRITFEPGDEFYGAELNVWMTAPLSLFLDMGALSDSFAAGQVTKDQVMSVFAPLIRRFAKSQLISWNVFDEDGEPVAADGDGLLAQDMQFVMAIITAWSQEVGRISAPLVEPSPNGSMSGAQ